MKMTDDVHTAVYFQQVTKLSKNSFPPHWSLHKNVNKPKFMTHIFLFFVMWCHWSEVVTDCYHGNTGLLPWVLVLS